MIRICIDTNALYGDPLWKKTHGRKLLDHVAEGTCRIHLSPVVDAELQRQVSDELGAEIDAIGTRIRTVAERQEIATDELLRELEAFRGRALQAATARQADLRQDEGFGIEEWPPVSAEELVRRELARRRPFIDTDGGTIGQRDTVIWHGVIEVARTYPRDEVVFITKDRGFLKDKALHPDLVDDLRAAGVDPSTVRRVPDVFAAVTLLDRISAAERLARFHVAVREALHDYNRELWQLQWAPDFDLRDGGMSEPDIDVGLTAAFEDATVTNIESTFDVSLDPPDPGDGEPAACTYEISIGFDGAMTKIAWYAGDHDDIEVWDADVNDHYTWVHTERRVRLTVHVAYDDQSDTATVEDLVCGERIE